jgi:hypothetical protein
MYPSTEKIKERKQQSIICNYFWEANARDVIFSASSMSSHQKAT